MKRQKQRCPQNQNKVKLIENKELQSKKEFGRLNTLENNELTELEKEQIEIIKSMSMREDEERKRIEEEEERILQQVLELSKEEHELEIQHHKEKEIEEKERILKEKEEELHVKEEKLKKEKKKLKKQKTEQEKSLEAQKHIQQTNNTETASTIKTQSTPISIPVGVIGEKVTKDKSPSTKDTATDESMQTVGMFNKNGELISVNKPKKKKKLVMNDASGKTIKRDMDLPPVMQSHKDANLMAGDYDILKEATNDLFRKKKDPHYDPYADFDPGVDEFKQDQGEQKSMRKLMEEKMKKMNEVESVEDRKARLKAQRDLIVKMKQEERDKELQEAREGKSDNKYSNNLFKDLLALDKKVNQQEQKKKHDQNKNPAVLKVEDYDENSDDESKEKQKEVKKDMKSLFEDSDEEDQKKKEDELKARQERQKQIMKQIAQESNI